jgi:hypothetical protein
VPPEAWNATPFHIGEIRQLKTGFIYCCVIC